MTTTTTPKAGDPNCRVSRYYLADEERWWENGLMIDDFEPLRGAEEVAEYLGCTKQTVYRARREKGLPSISLAKTTIRLRPSAVPDWVIEQETVTKEVSTPPEPERPPVALLD